MTDLIPALQKQFEEAGGRIAQQLNKKEQQAACSQKEMLADRVRVTCDPLVGGRAHGDADHLSTSDLVVLVRQEAGEVHANTKEENMNELVNA